MRVRNVCLCIALAMIALCGVAQAADSGSARTTVDDHFYLLNSTTDNDSLVMPSMETSVRNVRDITRSGSRTSDSGYAYATKYGKKASAKTIRSKSVVPTLWVGISCAIAGMGLVIVGAVAWRRYVASCRDWMTDENGGRVTYQRWVSSKVPTILASKLIQVQCTAVKTPPTVVKWEEAVRLRRAA